MLKLWVRKYLQFYVEKICLSKPVLLSILFYQQAKQLGKEDEQRLLKNKKLVLLVDLDQTLIHTTNDNIPPNLKVIDQTLIHTSNDNIPPNLKVIDQTLIHTTNDNIPPNLKVIGQTIIHTTSDNIPPNLKVIIPPVRSI